MMEKMKRLVMEEEGQGLSEYALILAGVVVVAVGVVATLSGSLEGLFKKVTGLIDTETSK